METIKITLPPSALAGVFVARAAYMPIDERRFVVEGGFMSEYCIQDLKNKMFTKLEFVNTALDFFDREEAGLDVDSWLVAADVLAGFELTNCTITTRQWLAIFEDEHPLKFRGGALKIIEKW